MDDAGRLCWRVVTAESRRASLPTTLRLTERFRQRQTMLDAGSVCSAASAPSYLNSRQLCPHVIDAGPSASAEIGQSLAQAPSRHRWISNDSRLY